MGVEERYRLSLTIDGLQVQTGWWETEAVARRKFIAWVGSYGSLPGTRVVLVDDETGETLTAWPDET
ncbi:hypothetical protein ACIQNG_13855 [Streptomyces sp. NPDC091377]|uniref:hypothetical protein n=1 Tax=unclassified Streptomyces TaxID=2593676 RepID=UPI003803C8B8